METLINPNQILGAGTKILNVAQTGMLSRSGAKYSGFSDSNYLQFSSRVSANIISLEENSLDLHELVDADNWEIGVKIKTPTNFSKERQSIIFTTSQYKMFLLQLYNYNYVEFGLGSGAGWTFDQETSFQCKSDTIYFNKISYNGAGYKLEISEADNEHFNTVYENTISTKMANGNVNIGNGGYQSGRGFDGNIFIDETYIKINGEYWWKGVETL